MIWHGMAGIIEKRCLCRNDTENNIKRAEKNNRNRENFGNCDTYQQFNNGGYQI